MILRIWWCPCVESSLVLLEEDLIHILFAFTLLNFVLLDQTCLLLQVSLDFLCLHSSPLWWKGHLVLMLVLEDLGGPHATIQVQLLWHYLLRHKLWLWCCWMVSLGTNQDHFVIFEIAPMYCILDSLVDCKGCSIPSKGFLPTVVDIMGIWIKWILNFWKAFSTCIGFQILQNLCIPRVNPTWSWCMILLPYCCI